MDVTRRVEQLELTGVSEPAFPAFDCTELFEKRSRYCLCVFVLNEGERIARQLQKMRVVAQDIDIVIADGGSTDGATSPEVCRDSGVRALLVKRGPGQLGAQMRMAFAYALSQGYEGVVTVDGNDKDDVAAGLSRIVQQLDAGVDHVQGSRFIRGGHHANTPLARWLGVKLVHAPLLSWVSAFPHTDTTNGFRGYSRRLLESPDVAVFRPELVGYELHYHLSLEAPRLGFRCSEVPVSRVYPESGKTPTKITSVRGNARVLLRLFAVAGGAYRKPDPWPGANLFERLVFECGRALPANLRRLRGFCASRSLALRTLVGVAAFAVFAFLFAKNQLGLYEPPAPLLGRAGFEPRCLHSALPRGACAATQGKLSFDAPELKQLHALTVEFWFRPRGFGGSEHILVSGRGTAIERYFFMSTFAPNASHTGLRISTPLTNGTWGRAQTADHALLTNDKWTHFVGSVDWRAGTMASYVDGRPVTIGLIETGGVRGSVLEQLTIAGEGDVSVPGDLGAVRIFDTYVTPAQVRRLYQGAAPGGLSASRGRALQFGALALLALVSIAGLMPRPLAWAAWVVVLSVALQASFADNAFGVAPQGWFATYERFSERLTFPPISDGRAPEVGGPGRHGLYWTDGPSADEYYALPLTKEGLPGAGYREYTSQFGLQSRMLLGLRRVGEWANRWDVTFLQSHVALVSGAVVSLLGMALMRTMSPAFGIGFLLGIFGSQWFTAFARNLYWQPWTWFLPLTLVLLVLGRAPLTLGRALLACVLAGAAVMLKSLCGYEYLSAVVLSACSAALLARMPGEVRWAVQMGRRALLFTGIAFSSVLGFLGAMALHGRLRANGAALEGMRLIYLHDARRRTAGGDPALFGPDDEAGIRAQVQEVLGIYLRGEYLHGVYFHSLVVLFVALLFAWAVFAVLRRRRIDGRFALTPDDETTATAALFAVSCLLASISWFVLAKAHSFVHHHMNHVMWTLSFAPALSGFCAHFAARLWAFRPGTEQRIQAD